jgi:hypothetical protein
METENEILEGQQPEIIQEAETEAPAPPPPATEAPTVSMADFAPPTPQSISPGKRDKTEAGENEPEGNSSVKAKIGAKALTRIFDQAQKTAAALYSGESADRYKLTDKDRAELVEVLAEYLETTSVEIPPWVAVLVAFSTASATTAMRAFEDKRRNQRAAQIQKSLPAKATPPPPVEQAKPAEAKIWPKEFAELPELKADRRNFRASGSGEFYDQTSDNKSRLGPTHQQTDPNPRPSTYFANFYEARLKEASAKGLKTDVAHRAANKHTRSECVAMRKFFGYEQ